MIELALGHVDLARLRFAHSPVGEIVASLRVLQERDRQHVYDKWIASARGRLGGLEHELDLLLALTQPGGYLPDFLLPQPTQPWGVLADELEVVVATPPEQVRAELEALYPDRPLPVVLRPLRDDPARWLPEVVEAIVRYWRAVIEPVWQRLQAICAADLSYRMERFVTGGVARVLEDLHPGISLQADRLSIDKPQHHYRRFDLTGTGLLLVPCAFSWPTLIVGCCGRARPMLTYPPRGVAELCQEPAEQTDPLGALLGRTRATLLALLDLPRTTTQLAEQLDLSPAAISQHLKILKDTMLVTADRRGRAVLYQRTSAAAALLAAIRPRDYAGLNTPS
jgi:DNA-binding transcriptional ArsR family regulator